MTLVIFAAQPNPVGKDRHRLGHVNNDQLNEEWVEFTTLVDCNLAGISLTNVTFTHPCAPTGAKVVTAFTGGLLKAGQRARVHTGIGVNRWEGVTCHVFAGHGAYVWNNDCGDRASLVRGQSMLDYAQYVAHPPEGILVRLQGTHLMVPSYAVVGALHR